MRSRPSQPPSSFSRPTLASFCLFRIGPSLVCGRFPLKPLVLPAPPPHNPRTNSPCLLPPPPPFSFVSFYCLFFPFRVNLSKKMTPPMKKVPLFPLSSHSLYLFRFLVYPCKSSPPPARLDCFFLGMAHLRSTPSRLVHPYEVLNPWLIPFRISGVGTTGIPSGTLPHFPGLQPLLMLRSPLFV